MSKLPPVPPQNRSPKEKEIGSDRAAPAQDPKPADCDNPAEQGQQGNIRQNTTNQGYQKNR